MKTDEMGMFFELSGQLMRRYEGVFDKEDKNGKPLKDREGNVVQQFYYKATVGWMGGKCEIALDKETFENLPPDGAMVTIEGTLFGENKSLKATGRSVETSGPSLDSTAIRRAKAA